MTAMGPLGCRTYLQQRGWNGGCHDRHGTHDHAGTPLWLGALSRNAKLHSAGLLGIALYCVYVAVALQQDFQVPITMFIGVALVLAAVVAAGLRRTPLLAAIGSSPLLVSVPYRLLHREQTGEFLGALLVLALLAVVIVGALARRWGTTAAR